MRGYIPARLGSERVRQKNLRPIAGRPLIAHTIDTVIASSIRDDFVVNTEAVEIAAVARACGIGVYMRDPALAANATRTDEIVYDFVRANPCDAVCLVNPTAPLLKTETLDRAIEAFRHASAQALFSVTPMKKHALLDGQPLNFSTDAPSPRTQDLAPVEIINFIICIFDAHHVVSAYERDGYFLYAGARVLFPMEAGEALDIDDEFDFRLVESVLANPRAQRNHIPA